MAESQWGGLVTNASPYAVPPGAATEQVNLSSSTPGQLSVRGGMQSLSVSNSAVTQVIDFYPFLIGGARAVIALKQGGTVVQISGLATGAAPATPSGLSMSPASGQVASNYIGQFFSTAGEPPV